MVQSGKENSHHERRQTNQASCPLRPVSTDHQTIKNQQLELEAVAERHGWEIGAVFKDQGISGAKGRNERPGLDKLLQAVARKEFDLVAAWSVDRIGRSLHDLVGMLQDLHASTSTCTCTNKASTRRRRQARRCFR